jgi:hypothetical protein
MIVLNIGLHLAVHFVLNFPLHAGVAAAEERTADFDTIDGRHHQSSGPVGTQHPVAFQLPGDLTTERKQRLGRLSLERIADGAVADRSVAFAQRSEATLSLHLQQTGNLHGGTEKDRVEHLLPGMLRKLPPLGAGSSLNQKSQTPYRDKPRIGAGSSGALFLLFFEKPLQVDAADGCGGGIEAVAHLDLFAHPLNQFGRDVESLRLAVNQNRDLVLGVETLAVGAMTRGATAGAFAFDKRARQHFAEITETADESAAQFQVGVGGLFKLTVIIVSEIRKIKHHLRRGCAT